MPNLYDTPIQLYLCLCNDAAFAMRENKETLSVHAQMKTRNFGSKAEWANWSQPIGRNPARRSRLIS